MVSTIQPETNYTAYLIDGLQGHYGGNCEVLVYTDKDSRNQEVKLQNIKLVWNRDWNFLLQIIRQSLKDKINIIHFQHEINMFGGPRTAVLFPFLVLATRLLGFKPVVTIHAAVPVREFNAEFLKVFEWPKPKLLAPFVRIIFPTIYFLIGLFAKKIIVHSPGIKAILSQEYKINGSKIEVIPHGVPEDVSYQLPAVSGQLLDKLAQKKFLLYFGYFHRRKGLEFLIRAFESISHKYPDLNLVLGGGTILPGYFHEIKNLVCELELSERVYITGFLRLPDLRFLLSHCEFVVLPAVYSIAASGPLAQVFAHEKAVIVSDLGVYAEEIRPDFNGLLARVGDASDLEKKILRLLEDPELCRSIIKNVSLIRRERSWQAVAGKTLKVYEALK